MRFVKMHGIGNDYIYIDCFEQSAPQDIPALAVEMSRPHFGVGSDGLVLILPSETADCRMRMFNKDGSEGIMCGNAVRCVGKYMHDTGRISGDELSVETLGGIKHLKLTAENGICTAARVDMGVPSFVPEEIPVAAPENRVEIETPDGTKLRFTCVSVGNPHAVTFDLWPEDEWFYKYGPWLEQHPLFPDRINVEFARVNDRGHIDMRVWERGSGETLACGTGACASLVAAVLTGRADRQVTMDLLGGSLELDWSFDDGHVYQEGPATFVFDGEWLGEESSTHF